MTPARAADIAAHVSLFLGVVNVAAVAAFHYPAYLTTPAFRAAYEPDTLRILFGATILLSFALGIAAIIGRQYRRLAAGGIALTTFALLLGGPTVPVPSELPVGTPSLGLDWLILDLLFSALVFIMIEKAIPHRPADILRAEWRLDLVHFSVNHLLVGVTLLLANAFAAAAFGWARSDVTARLVAALPFALELLLAVLVADLIQYAIHRAFHEVPWLWKVHRVHHSPQRMDWMSGSRIHVIELLATRALVFVPIFVLGFRKEVIDVYVILVGLQGVLNHANIQVRWGVLGQLLVTPQFHHWHHASDPEAIDKNYAAHFPWLDNVFGTRVRSAKEWPERYGLVGDALPPRYLAHLAAPFAFLAKKTKKSAEI